VCSGHAEEVFMLEQWHGNRLTLSSSWGSVPQSALTGNSSGGISVRAHARAAMQLLQAQARLRSLQLQPR
jgi:hypothetical protein